ncbi:bactericidal permeability-increasing protein-like [Asterias rubens]|uniref:bactericidal permeability-increasing protein-like n=1 Tax=Asterias rubens TaxID=7604 RepID=UPI0014559DCF|nr:bactericidal permeability-increasing protein-like [Asterias rubens]
MALNKLNLLFVVILSVYFSPAVESVNPGFKGRITQSGLDYMRDVGLQVLKEEVQQLKIPDITGDAHVPVVGHITYTVSNIRITSFSIPPTLTSLTTKTGVGLTLAATGISLSAWGNWHYSNHGFIHISDSGSFDASVSSTSLMLTLRIGVDNSGRPTISMTTQDCSFNAGNVRIKLHGGASWLYNLFSKDIAGVLKSSINQQTCSMVMKEVNDDLEMQLAKIKVEAHFDKNAWVNYSLVAPPTFTGHIDTAHKGEVFPAGPGPHTEAPFTVPVIPSDPDESRHMFLWITDYMLETAGYVYYKAGVLAYNATQDKLPPGFKYKLNTDALAVELLLPQLNEKFPNMPMQVNVKAIAPPMVRFTQPQINASVNLQIDVFVINKDKSLTFAVSLGVVVHGSASLGCVENAAGGSSLTWTVKLRKTDVTLKRSAIGKIDTDGLAIGIEFACNAMLVPWINEAGKKGMPLPNAGNVKLQKPVIQQGQGFVKLGTDILFIPSE